MRKTTLLCVCIALTFASTAKAQKSEFDALLEDVTFGAAEQMVNTQDAEPIPAPETTIALPPATAAPIPQAPQPIAEPVQAAPAPVAVPEPVVADHQHAAAPQTYTHASASSCGDGCSSCQSCKTRHHFHKKDRIRDAACVPYQMPRLPTSTFYQYWRTNACYTNVWDGYRNRCPPQIDLSIKKKSNCSTGCASGACQTLPAEWTAAGSACDTCR